MMHTQNRQFLIIDRFDLGANGVYLKVEDFRVLAGDVRTVGTVARTNILSNGSPIVSPSCFGVAREQYALVVTYKDFSLLCRHTVNVMELAPAYDIVSTTGMR